MEEKTDFSYFEAKKMIIFEAVCAFALICRLEIHHHATMLITT